MLPLPELEAEERACLQALLPGAAVQTLAGRLRQALLAALGVPVSVDVKVIEAAQAAANAPVIRIDADLAAIWLAARLGGRPRAMQQRLGDESLADALRLLLRRVLAESVINGGDASWPGALRLAVTIGGGTGVAEIFWDGAQATAWARQTIRERT